MSSDDDDDNGGDEPACPGLFIPPLVACARSPRAKSDFPRDVNAPTLCNRSTVYNASLSHIPPTLAALASRCVLREDAGTKTRARTHTHRPAFTKSVVVTGTNSVITDIGLILTYAAPIVELLVCNAMLILRSYSRAPGSTFFPRLQDTAPAASAFRDSLFLRHGSFTTLAGSLSVLLLSISSVLALLASLACNFLAQD